MKILRHFYVANVEDITDLRLRHKKFDAIHDQICSLGTDSFNYFGHSYSLEGGYYLQQNPEEFAAFCLFLEEKSPYTNYLEIGTASGGTCLYLYNILRFQNVMSIDDGTHRRAAHQKEFLSQIPNVTQFIGDSHSKNARTFIRNNLKGHFNIVFIDGDHRFKGAWQDVQLVLPFSKPGTLLIFHDTVAAKGVEKIWVHCIRKKIIVPLAEFIGTDRPMGIGVGQIL